MVVSILAASVIVPDHQLVAAVNILDDVTGELIGRMDQKTTVDANDTADDVGDKTQIMGDQDNGPLSYPEASF